MKKTLTFILILFSCLSYSQVDKFVMSNGRIVTFNGKQTYYDSFPYGKILKLDMTNISTSDLTYNPSSDLVTWASNDTVVLDGSDNVKINNYVRIGSPTSGTIYQVIDTLGSSDSIVIDQNFTGSVTNQYYFGCVNTWTDQSGNNNNVAQSSTIRQLKFLGNSLYNDNSDWMLFADTIYNEATIWTVSCVIDNYKESVELYDFAFGGAASRNLAFKYIARFGYRDNVGAFKVWLDTDGTSSEMLTSYFYDDNSHSIIFRSDGTRIYLTVDNMDKGYITPSSTHLFVNYLMAGYVFGTYTAHTEYSEFNFWDRCLTDQETNKLTSYYHNKYGTHYVYWYDNISLHNIDTIPLLVGTTYNMQSDEISLIPIGYNSSVNYTYTCDIGSFTSNSGNLINNTTFQKSSSYNFTPVIGDVGYHSLNVKAYYNGILKNQITKVIQVINPGNGGGGSKTIMYVGNSITFGGANTMIDTVTKSITGIDLVNVGSFGSDPNKNTGVSSASTTSFLSPASPFYDGSRINIPNYRANVLGMASPFDFIVINLGVNDVWNDNTPMSSVDNLIIPNITALIDSFLLDNAVNIIVACPTNSENSGTGWISQDPNLYQAKLVHLREVLITKFGNKNYAPNVHVSMHANYLDRDDDYPVDGSGNHDNNVHPNNDGQYQIGKSVTATIEKILLP